VVAARISGSKIKHLLSRTIGGQLPLALKSYID
jgi:hypothetical protein